MTNGLNFELQDFELACCYSDTFIGGHALPAFWHLVVINHDHMLAGIAFTRGHPLAALSAGSHA